MPKAARKDKKKKDPNAPKRPLAPYMFFCKDRREDIKAENPDVSFGEIGKILGQEWSSMSDKEKRPYIQKAEKDKERYTEEMASYEPHSD